MLAVVPLAEAGANRFLGSRESEGLPLDESTAPGGSSQGVFGTVERRHGSFEHVSGRALATKERQGQVQSHGQRVALRGSAFSL